MSPNKDRNGSRAKLQSNVNEGAMQIKKPSLPALPSKATTKSPMERHEDVHDHRATTTPGAWSHRLTGPRKGHHEAPEVTRHGPEDQTANSFYQSQGVAL